MQVRVAAYPRFQSGAFWLGMGLLAACWLFLFWVESYFTESHLVTYYCCVIPENLPAYGTLERAASDFFRSPVGQYLPSLIFLLINVFIFGRRVGRRYQSYWLPWWFITCYVLYVIADFWLVVLSWSISDWMLGPQPYNVVYKGYVRTWYGIVLHLLLWLVLFAAVRQRKLLQRIAQGFSSAAHSTG